MSQLIKRKKNGKSRGTKKKEKEKVMKLKAKKVKNLMKTHTGAGMKNSGNTELIRTPESGFNSLNTKK